MKEIAFALLVHLVRPGPVGECEGGAHRTQSAGYRSKSKEGDRGGEKNESLLIDFLGTAEARVMELVFEKNWVKYAILFKWTFKEFVYDRFLIVDTQDFLIPSWLGLISPGVD
jgi:hypothetical protein